MTEKNENADLEAHIDEIVEIPHESIENDAESLKEELNGLRKSDKKVLKKEKHASNPFALRTGKTLSWSNVKMHLAVKGAKDRKLLDRVWGEVPNKEITAIMGPSGSGKTSLLNILAGRARSRGKITIGSDVKIDGASIDPTDIEIRKQIAFVAQEESLQITATPREAIMFSAKLRLSRFTTDKNIKKLTKIMLEELGLEDCADTLIGGGLVKGISGGQKKRTSVGVELVVKPSMVFLDEPTSGLDSFSAIQLVQVLKKVANAGASVLFTIHQPPSQVFNSFDHLILLNKGRVMYEGEVDDIPSFFASCNKPMPERFNPADWILQVAQAYSIDELERDGFFPRHRHERHSSRRVTTKAQKDQDSDSNHVPFSTQISMLFVRELRNFRRDTVSVAARFGITIFINVLSGVIFWKVGSTDSTNPQNLQSHMGALVMVLLSAMFATAQPVLLAFPTERPVFLREYSTNHYSVGAYFISRFVVEGVLVGVQTLVTVVLAYFMMGFQANFFIFFLSIYVLALASDAIAIFLGCIIEDPKVANEMLPLLFVPQMLFAGFFVVTDLIPKWLRWCQYVCYLTYSLRIVLQAEFGNCEGAASFACNQLLSSVGVKEDDISWYWFALILLFVVFRLVALWVLRAKATKFY